MAEQNNKLTPRPPGGQFLVYEAEDGEIKIDVRLEDKTVWLTQPLMADLFQTTQQNISQHILSIYDEGELEREATHKKFLSVRQEGARAVKRRLEFYNLDMIISESRKSISDFDKTISKIEQKKKRASEKE